MVAIPHSLLLPCAPIFVGYSRISYSIASSVQYMTLEKYFSHLSCSYLLFSNPIKLKLGLQIGGRLQIATHLNQSNYLANQEQGVVSKYSLTVFIRLFQGSSRALKAVLFSRVKAVFQ